MSKVVHDEKETAGKERSLDGYGQLLKDIKSILQQGLSKAYKAVDNLKVQTYWQIGERVVREELRHEERADYGQKIIDHLAEDLQLSRSAMFSIVAFYKTYPIVQTLSGQLSWSHYLELITIGDKEKRIFYELQIIHNMWSVRELKKQIQNNAYERARRAGKLTITLPVPLKPTLPEDIFKDIYHFDFLKLDGGYAESDLEDGLISNIEKLLLEFGSDFSLSGRQRKIIIDGQAHAVDLEFYHRGIPCVILVDLKIGNFKSEYVGQMNKYLNWYRENKKYAWEKEPVGLIICQKKGAEEVHYALGGISNRIFVAEYRTKLPSEEDIKKALVKKAPEYEK
ncbi:MAG: PDDEXK nuclease domain-containing protein [archaeon]